MNITIGNPVWGDDFFDREEILARLWEILKTDSVLLAAPRRVGKTSLMRKLYDEPMNGFKVLWLDGQNYRTPEDLAVELATKAGEMKKDPKRFFRRWVSGTVNRLEELEVWELRFKLREQLPQRWELVGEAIIQDLVNDGTKLLIVIDELAMLLHNMIHGKIENGAGRAQELLDWLRHIRQEPYLNAHVRQVLGGSIGLPHVASLIGSSHKINDLRALEVGPFDRKTARRLATGLLASRNVTLSEQIMEAFLDQIETFLPIFVQIMASAVAAEVHRRKQEATVELIQECYEQRAMGTEFRIVFEDYYERLARYYSPEDAQIAKIFLRELALLNKPLSKSHLLGTYQKELGDAADPQKFDLLLTWLHDDFYLVDNGDGQIAFKSRWIRDWWRRYHGSKSSF